MSTILTPAQTCGPLFGFALFPDGLNQSVDPQSPDAVTVEGTVYDGAGETVGYGAFVEFWSEGQACRARTLEGRFRVTMARPPAVTVPAQGTQAPCLDIYVFTRGLALPLLTRMYFPQDAHLHETDPVMQRVPPEWRHRLVALEQGTPGRFRHDIHLQGPSESVFLDPPVP